MSVSARYNQIVLVIPLMRATSYEKKKIPTNNLSLFEATCKLLLSQRLQGRWRTSTDLSSSQALSSYTEVLKKEYL